MHAARGAGQPHVFITEDFLSLLRRNTGERRAGHGIVERQVGPLLAFASQDSSAHPIITTSPMTLDLADVLFSI